MQSKIALGAEIFLGVPQRQQGGLCALRRLLLVGLVYCETHAGVTTAGAVRRRERHRAAEGERRAQRKLAAIMRQPTGSSTGSSQSIHSAWYDMHDRLWVRVDASKGVPSVTHSNAFEKYKKKQNSLQFMQVFCP